MSDWHFWFYVCLLLVGLVLSALYSGLETGMYTLNRIRLNVKADTGERAAYRLRRELQHPTRMLIVLLIGTNVANYLGSFSLAELLHRFHISQWTLIGLEALIFTPILFVFAETLPKDLFRRHTDRWSYSFSHMIVTSRWLFVATGMLLIVQGITTLLNILFRHEGEQTLSDRQRMSQLIKEGIGSGVISEVQTTWFERALALRDRTVRDEMVLWSQVVTIPLSADRQRRESIMQRNQFSRFPVVDDDGHIVGLLRFLAAVLDPHAPTADLMEECVTFTSDTSVREALRLLRQQQQNIAVVIDASTQRPLGLVTLKDLVEPLTGELAAW